VVGVCDEKALVMSRRADIGEEVPRQERRRSWYKEKRKAEV
jgi:hypothetical protein